MVHFGGMNGSLNHLTAAILETCRRHPVGLAYLFGSHARAAADLDSDIDVAVLVDESLSKDKRLQLRFALMRELAEAIGTDIEQMDVVVLQDMPVLLQYNVIRNGIEMMDGDGTKRRTYELFVERRYDDEWPFLERERQLTIDRILAHP